MRLYAYFKNCAVIIKQSFLEQIFLALSCATVEAMDDKWYPIQNVYGKDSEMVVAMYVIYHSRQQERSNSSLTLIPWLGFMAFGLGTLALSKFPQLDGCLRAKILSLTLSRPAKIKLDRKT